ncbi:MAG: hypothetical protein M1839_000060 [Geoglossum umbratile]|nr:MAG: hypothetical protein M1839_000060 [Geoglossum umbratile]
MALPASQYAIQVRGQGQAEVVANASIPKLRDNYILVKTEAVALNPTDWKHVDYLPTPGALLGCDYAGTVVEVGKGVTKGFKKGDRIAGFVHGSNQSQLEDGAYAEYIVARGDVQMRIPDNVSFEEAATLGVGIITVGQGLYQSLGLQLPTKPVKENIPVLVYGGSTATGTLAIQFAKLSGYTVVTTCSPRNFDLVKSLGADAVFHYNDPNCAAEIRKFTNDKLFHVFDTISSDATAAICAGAIGTAGGKYSCLVKPLPNMPRDDVESQLTFAYTGAGETFSKGPTEFPAVPEDYEFQKDFWNLAETLLGDEKFKVHPPHVGKGGLEGVLEGLQLMREDKVSGQKLVYRVAETPK